MTLLQAAEKAVVDAAIVYLNTGPKAPHGGSYAQALKGLQAAVALVLNLRAVPKKITLKGPRPPAKLVRQMTRQLGKIPTSKQPIGGKR